jgi:hypothetical protein
MTDVHFSTWQLSESQEIAIADDLSRVINVSKFAMDCKVFKSICLFKHPARGRIWGFPTGNASAGAQKGFHKASRYFITFAAPRALADAFVRD